MIQPRRFLDLEHCEINETMQPSWTKTRSELVPSSIRSSSPADVNAARGPTDCPSAKGRREQPSCDLSLYSRRCPRASEAPFPHFPPAAQSSLSVTKEIRGRAEIGSIKAIRTQASCRAPAPNAPHPLLLIGKMETRLEFSRRRKMTSLHLDEHND